MRGVASWREEFRHLAGFEPPARIINALDSRLVRADVLFDFLARLCFDRPVVGDALKRRLGRWLKQAPQSEEVWALAGYLHYCRKDYARAKKAFLKAVALRNDNLDNWLDLAMTLRHLGDPLGLEIIFQHDSFIRICRQETPRRINCSILRRLGRLIADGTHL